MASSTVVQQGVDMFRERSVEKIILVGVSGVGKTWTAKQLSKHAIKEGLFEIALWVFCNRKYYGTALSESIARQLSLLPIADEWEVEDKKGGKEEENHEDLQTMIAKSLEKKKVLLIFDDEGNKMKEGQIMLELETLLNPPNVSSYKVLITSTNAPTGSKDEILVKPLSVEESVRIYVLLIDVLIDRLQDALITIPIQSIYRRKCGSRCSGGDSGLGEVECVVE
ncbi:hypothetical protein CsSME_00012253 [Camellia sinensis var. sinensis]